jgi:hypothetical protein
MTTSTKLAISSFLAFYLATAASSHPSEPQAPLRDAGIRTVYQFGSTDILATISNWGELGNPDQHIGYVGFSYPKGSRTDFLFAAGIWIGAKVGETRLVSTTTDGDNGTNEFAPTLDRFLYESNAMDSGRFHFSLIACDEDQDWNAETDDLDGDGRPSLDYDGPQADANGDGIFIYDPEPHIDEDPPGDISHDHIDNDGDGLVDEADDDADGDLTPDSDDDDDDGLIDEDGAAFAGELLTSVIDDLDVQQVRSPDPDGHTPLGIQIAQKSYTLDAPIEIVRNTLFLQYDVTNIGNDTLLEVYPAFFADPDIAAADEVGDQASADDWIVCHPDLLLVIAGDDTTDDDEEGPGVLGMVVLAAPTTLAELAVGFNLFDRLGGGDPETNRNKYNMIAVSGEDRIEPPSQRPGDWRYLMSFGPLDREGLWNLLPGEELSFTIALFGAPDIASARQAAIDLQEYFEGERNEIFRGNYFPRPCPPRLVDPGNGESLLASWPPYRKLPTVSGGELSYGLRGEEASVIDVSDTTTITIQDLNDGEEYYFNLTLIDDDGERGDVSDTSWMTPLAVPRKPKGLGIIDEGLRQITLAWEANRELDIAGYRLFRSFDGGEFAALNEEPLAALTFTDRAEQFGIYRYHLSAIDRDGNESAILGEDSLDVVIQGAPFTIEDNRFLLIDETRNGNGRPGSANDAQADSFYTAILGDFAPQFSRMDYDSFFSSNNRTLAATELGPYSLIIWCADDKANFELYKNIELLRRYSECGGRLMVCGWDVLGGNSVADSIAPVEGNVLRNLFGITSTRRSLEREFAGVIGQDQYPDLQIDQEKVPANWNAAIDRCWIFEVEGEYLPVGWFMSTRGDSPFHNQLCGFIKDDAVLLGFPLYYLGERDAQVLMRELLAQFGLGVDPTSEPVVREFSLEYCYPNPFNSRTRVTFSIDRPGLTILSIRDLCGREVAGLLNQDLQVGHYSVDVDLQGAPNGIYYCYLKQGDQVRARKILLLK